MFSQLSITEFKLHLDNFSTVLIENLRQKNLLLEAIEHIYAFEVVDKYRPVRLLKDYLYAKRTIYVGSKSPSKNVTFLLAWITS